MNPIAEYKDRAKISLGELSAALDVSIGHACDLVKGNKPMTVRTAKALAKLTGKPWHKYL